MATYNRVTSDTSSGSGGNPISIKDEGSTVVAEVTSINFTGAGVSVADAGGGQVDVTIAGTASPYSLNFSFSDWVNGVTYSTITVPQATHLKSVFPTVTVYEVVAFNLEKVNTEVILDASGNVTIQVLFVPDLRFSGKLIIS